MRRSLERARQQDLDQFEEQLVTLKRSLKKLGVPSEAAKELDELRMDIEDRWAVALETIVGSLSK